MSFLIGVGKGYCTSLQNKIGTAASYISSTFEGSKVKRVANTILGREAIRTLAENVAEGLGYYGGSKICAPLGKELGRAVIGAAALATSIGVSTLTGWNVAKWVYANTKSLNSSIARGSLCILTFSALFYFTYIASIDIRRWAEFSGGTAGEFIADIGGGTLVAFKAMRYFNTTEVLWGPNIAYTYLFKSLQSMAVCALANYCEILPSGTISSPLANLLLGSLSYNALDIARFARSAMKGTLLKGLPTKIPGFSIPELIMSAQQFQSGAARPMIPKEVLTCQSIFSQVINHPLFSQALQKIILLASMRNPSKKLLLTNMTRLIAAYNAANVSTNLIGQGSSITVIRTLNLYFHLLKTHPELLDDPDQNSPQLQKVIFEELIRLGTVVGVHPSQLNALKSLFFSPQGLFRKDLVSNEVVETMAKYLVDSISTAEKKTIFFKLSSEQQQEKAKKKIAKQLKWIFRLAPLVTSISFIIPSCTQDELVEFYKNLNLFICDYYQHVVGERGANFVRSALDYQITHSIK
jgi:hypothetical protein